jgi:hypothetical protein
VHGRGELHIRSLGETPLKYSGICKGVAELWLRIERANLQFTISKEGVAQVAVTWAILSSFLRIPLQSIPLSLSFSIAFPLPLSPLLTL